MTRADVVVVGAGLTGLTAAHLLHDAGAQVVVLEANTRLGGRIHGVRDAATGRIVADLGPTWVWPPYQPIVARWIDRLGLELFQQYDRGLGILDGWSPDVQRYQLPGQDGIARLVGGPSSMIAALAARLPADRIRLTARVDRVARGADATIHLSLASGESVQAAQVVLAVPLRVAARSISIPDLDPAVRRALHGVPTWMSAQAKAVATFDRPFWRDAGLSGRIASRVGPLAEAHDHSPADDSIGVLFGFVQWPAAARQEAPDALRDAIVDQLVRCLGPLATSPRALHIEDWSRNPFICTETDIEQPGQHPAIAPANLRGTHLDGALQFAVSELSTISPGLIEGALDVGERVAATIR